MVETKKEVETKNDYEPSMAALVGKKAISVEVISPKRMEQLLLAHPVMSSGIDKKANRIINRSYTIVGGREEIREYCSRIIELSGGETFLKRWIKDAYGFGTSFAQLANSKDGLEVVKCVLRHPVYYGFYKESKKKNSNTFFMMDEDLSIVFDKSTGLPEGFCDYVYVDKNTRVPVKSTKVPYDRVADLKFDTWGDEVEGTSVLQYVNNTIKQTIKIEDAGAEQLYRNGFTQKKFTTNIRSVKKLEEFAKTVADLNDSDAIILLDGTDVDNLQPGQSDFVNFHKEFLGQLSIALGIPKALLTMDGSEVNKSSMAEMRTEMYQDSYADELIVKRTIDEKIFIPACKLKFPEAGPEDLPEFIFNKRPLEVTDALERRKVWSQTMNNMSVAIKALVEAGQGGAAKKLVDSLGTFKIEDVLPIRAKFENLVSTKSGVQKAFFNKACLSRKKHVFDGVSLKK